MTCAICDKPLAPSPRRPVVFPNIHLCARCYGRKVIIRSAAVEHLNARTFYISSFETPANSYIVKQFKHRTTCTCPDFVNRGQVLGVPCKHIRLLRLLAHAVGGMRFIRRGVSTSFRLQGSKERV